MVGGDADDVVQEAALRAFKSFDRWRGNNARAWLLTITRNCCCTLMQANGRWAKSIDGDSEAIASEAIDPGEVLTRQVDIAALQAAVAALPAEFREAIVLREFEQLDYKQIAAVVGVPIGTVMSRLARARERLRAALKTTQENG